MPDNQGPVTSGVEVRSLQTQAGPSGLDSSSLCPMSDAEGFWSYVRRDDQAEGGRIARLAHDLADQYEMITTETIKLFLDSDRISWGDHWREEIDKSLATAVFFVAVLTPRYFLSSECRRELQAFARQAEKLGIRDLILPLHYVNVPGLDGDITQDEAIKLVKNFQMEDWRQLRFADATSSEYRKAVAALAQRLADANQAIIANDLNTMPGDDTPSALFVSSSNEEIDSELIDLLMRGDSRNKILEKINAEYSNINEIEARAAKDLDQADRAEDGNIIRSWALDIAQPAERILELAGQYSTQTYASDEATRMLISVAPRLIESRGVDKRIICSYFATVNNNALISRQAISKCQDTMATYTKVEPISRDLRPPFQVLRKALAMLIEALSVIDGWAKAVENSPLDCKDLPVS
jgi:hypothetical protein